MTRPAGFRVRASVALDDAPLRRALRSFTDRAPLAQVVGLAGLDDPDALRDAARAIRARGLGRAHELLDAFATRLEERGVTVFWAADAAEAAAYVRDVCRRRGARVVAKSKSMASEEIGLNDVLSADGVRVVETDLGEFICQVAGEPPSHILAPAIHHDVAGVARSLSADAGRALEPDAKTLAAYARDRLREVFFEADVGVSGVNFGVAETGTLVIVTNEGNGRMVTSLPPVHVAVMGMERIVDTWDELDVLLTLLPRSATGQALTVYTSLISGPRREGEADGPEELHVVILDNGRSEVLGSAYREILHCIRCGACLNVCPVYRQVGGHAYGSVYGGPVGAVLTPLLQRDQHDLAGASSLCGACHAVCPVRIPIQDLLLRLRADEVRRAPRRGERVAFRVWSRAWSSSAGYRWSGRAARAAGRMARRSRRLPGPLGAWGAGREMPEPARESFLEARRRSRS